MLDRYGRYISKMVWFVLLSMFLSGCAKTAQAQPEGENEPSIANHTEVEVISDELLNAIQPLVEGDQNCVDCHSDKDQLISTGEEEEVVEAESSGEG